MADRDVGLFQITGAPHDVERFVDLVRPFGIKEMMRTGRIAMVRGPQTHRTETENGDSHRPAAPELATAV